MKPIIAALVFMLASVWLATTAHAVTPPTPPSVVATRSDPDQTGVRSSAYTGRYYRAVDEGYRRCIFTRESNANYASTGNNGGYQGGYQMTRALARGAAWMMAPEIRANWPDHWRLVRDLLLDTPASRWSRYWQDAAFWTVLNWDHDRRGAFHWSGGRWACWPGMVWR